MKEIKVTIPENLRDKGAEIERAMRELVFAEEKRRMLSMLLDKLMSNAKQLSDEELVVLGRKLKKGRFNELKQN